ncbi:sigma-E factor negative regulatory protein [Thalassomonas haliotis]|uniref:Anti-sigma-E factor RseA n=1 Tax=Thalassomonas haliotis TaxID=485448 RepID=A0ABY7VH07_9GAMM|nr:RseA family anti-sigma factor [Thalassomonas haliotis]WDE12808.1 transcriptional regulator [Thalassomonas haliotis]
MSETKFESVSSLVDNYQVNDAELDNIAKDKEMSDAWQRYHMIGDMMRDDVPQALELDLSDEIAAAIAQEPTVLAPKESGQVFATIKAKVVQFAKPAGQMAIAASAAGLMIFGVGQQSNTEEELIPSQVIQTAPFGGIANPVSYNTQSNSRQAQKQAYVEQHRRFQALLSDHQQQIKLSAIGVDSSAAAQQENLEQNKQDMSEEKNK